MLIFLRENRFLKCVGGSWGFSHSFDFGMCVDENLLSVNARSRYINKAAEVQRKLLAFEDIRLKRDWCRRTSECIDVILAFWDCLRRSFIKVLYLFLRELKIKGTGLTPLYPFLLSHGTMIRYDTTGQSYRILPKPPFFYSRLQIPTLLRC